MYIWINFFSFYLFKVVIYFTATWCGPCRYMEPTINELAAKCTDVDLVKIDVDELFVRSLFQDNLYKSFHYNTYLCVFSWFLFFKLKFANMTGWLQNISRQFGIQTMPTFLFMKKGKQVDKVVGARKEDFQKKVEKHRA